MAIILIAALVFAILSDLLLDIFSVRISLSSGRFQAWTFEHFGQNLLIDFFFSIFYQFFSFRKKAFFLQMSSLINVGSFNRRQILILICGSLMGMGLSVGILACGQLYLGVGLILLSLPLGLLGRDQLKDLSVGLLVLGLFYCLFYGADLYFSSSPVNIHPYRIPEAGVLLLVFLTTLLFRTPVAFLIFVWLVHFLIGLSLPWLVGLFAIHSVTSLLSFYWMVIRRRSRLKFAMAAVLGLQALQFGLVLFFVLGFPGLFANLSSSSGAAASFQFICVFYIFYYFGSTLLMVPFVFLSTLLPFFDISKETKSESQKIMIIEGRGQCYSVHLSLFLLRQEFKKFTTSVHTVFKLSRESDHGEDQINQKFVRYHGMLGRVGDELKELCFNIGKQRSYRWQVAEVMGYYRYVNQLELLIDDLAYITSLLRQEGLDEEWEKDCRFWLGLQLMIFESFLNYVVGVGKTEPEKVKASVDKSYEILDRFFTQKINGSENKNVSQTFYRITESIANLAL